MPDEVMPDAGANEEAGQEESLGAAQDVVTQDEEAEPEATPQEEVSPEAASSEEEAAGQESPESSDSDNQAAEAEAEAEAAMLAMLDKDASKSDEGDKGGFPDLSGIKTEEPIASRAEFQQLSSSRPSEEYQNNIDILLDVKMPVAIELGRTEMPISDLLSLGPGSVVELNKLAGEPVDLLVNSKIIAKGEVVVVDENFGVRITQLLSPEERLRSLAQD